MSAEATLRRLRESLPHFSEAAKGDNADEQARATLCYLVDRIVLVGDRREAPMSVDCSQCPNCGKVAPSERSPYCCPECREEASFVRQFRSHLVDESIFDLERQATLGQILWHQVGGGYPRRNALVSEKDRARVFAKTDGKCDECGAEATTFDHIGTACNRTINLRPMCSDCAVTKPFGDPRIVAGTEFDQTVGRLATRIVSAVALQPCDDAETWDWRAFLASRKKANRAP